MRSSGSRSATCTLSLCKADQSVLWSNSASCCRHCYISCDEGCAALSLLSLGGRVCLTSCNYGLQVSAAAGRRVAVGS